MVVNISMRKMILEVEFLKSMIYEILKIFRRITFYPETILRQLFKKNTGLLIFNSLKQKKLIFNFFVNLNCVHRVVDIPFSRVKLP